MSGSGSGRTGIYVYGVIAGDASPTVFDAAVPVDSEHGIILVREGPVAAVTSIVPLDEFGSAAIEENLRDPTWLEQKVRRHDAVLQAAVGETTVLPFRFGAIYTNDQHVRGMLSEREDLVAALERLHDKLEYGVSGFADLDRLRETRAAERGLVGTEATSGADYMRRRQLDRELEETVRSMLAEWARVSHEALAGASDESVMNMLRRPEAADGRQMFLNGAYLVATAGEERFQTALEELRASFAGEGADYDLTGPWPPYNFANEEGKP